MSKGEESTPLLSSEENSDSSYDERESGKTTKAGASSESKSTFSQNQKLQLANLCVGSLWAGCCIAIMIPFFPHEAKRRQLSQTVSGAVYSCYAASQLVFFPIHGRLAPRVGVSKYYNSGLAIAGVTTVVFGMLPLIPDSTLFICACFVTRMLEAMGTSAMYTSARTILVNLFPDRTSTAIGFMETMTGVGLSLGPGIGAGLYHLAGYGAPFFSLGAVMLLSAAASFAMLPDTGRTERTQQLYGGMYCRFFSAVDNWLCCATVLAVAMNWTALDPNMEPYVNRVLNIDPAQLGIFFLVASCVYTVSNVIWGRVSELFANTFAMMSVCLAAAGLGVMLIPPSPILGLAPSWWLLGTGMLTRQLFQGGAFVPVLDRMVKGSVACGMENNVHTQSFLSSVMGSAFALGFVVGPVVGGLVIDVAGYPVAATCVGGFSWFVAALLAWRAAMVEISRRKRAFILPDATSKDAEKQGTLNRDVPVP